MVERHQERVQRWITKDNAALVLSLIKGETSIQGVPRQRGLTVAEMKDQQQPPLLTGLISLRARPENEEAPQGEQVKKLKPEIRDLIVDFDIFKHAAKRHPPMPKTAEP